MHIDLSLISPSEVYFNIIQTLVPRPVAWVLSENAGGSHNLAPFSYFNAISSDPPMLMISVGKKPDGSPKDTHVNIEARREFVVHIAHREMLEAMNQSSATLPAEVSELDASGLDTVPLPGSRIPRIAGTRVAFACVCHEIHEIGNTPQAMILGKINGIYIADEVTSVAAKGRLKVHADRLNPVARLGASEYMACGEIITLARPR